MQAIPIQAIPNQAFSILLDTNQWDFEIKTTNGMVSVSLTLNGVVLIENLRAVTNGRIIPSKYEEAGNFAIIAQNQNVPDYTQFGTTQTLVYISPTDLTAARVPSTDPYITAADFDPIAALPLRFAPQGYVLAS